MPGEEEVRAQFVGRHHREKVAAGGSLSPQPGSCRFPLPRHSHCENQETRGTSPFLSPLPPGPPADTRGSPLQRVVHHYCNKLCGLCGSRDIEKWWCHLVEMSTDAVQAADIGNRALQSPPQCPGSQHPDLCAGFVLLTEFPLPAFAGSRNVAPAATCGGGFLLVPHTAGV